MNVQIDEREPASGGGPGRRRSGGALAVAFGLAMGVAGTACAQYKVVGPDGRVTYSDRPAAGAGLRTETLRPGGDPSSGGVALPYALRQVVARFPVTLYTAPGCAPCDAARGFLQVRGVPFAERTVPSDADISELNRLERTTDLPILRLGTQRLLGWNPGEYAAMLDAAGYPRESVLPLGYRGPAPVPLVPGATDGAGEAAAPSQGQGAGVTAGPAVPPPTPAGEGGIRF